VPGDFKTHLPRMFRAIDFALDKYNKKLAEAP
jgi:hypothetical protein